MKKIIEFKIYVFIFRSDGETVLSKVHGCVHPQVVSPPPHRRSLLRHRVPAYAVHGPPWVSPQKTGKPVRSQTLRVQDSPLGIPGKNPSDLSSKS